LHRQPRIGFPALEPHPDESVGFCLLTTDIDAFAPDQILRSTKTEAFDDRHIIEIRNQESFQLLFVPEQSPFVGEIGGSFT